MLGVIFRFPIQSHDTQAMIAMQYNATHVQIRKYERYIASSIVEL